MHCCLKLANQVLQNCLLGLLNCFQYPSHLLPHVLHSALTSLSLSFSCCAQVIIINFLGIIFHVQPLNWQEWLVTVAIGAGAMIWSFLVRFISRTFFAGRESTSRGCWAAITARLTRMNQVTSKQLQAAAAVYDSNKLCGVEMSVQEAVTLAREKSANKDVEDESSGGRRSFIKAWLGRGKGEAGSKEERTLSGRSDSAGSLGRLSKK